MAERMKVIQRELKMNKTEKVKWSYLEGQEALVKKLNKKIDKKINRVFANDVIWSKLHLDPLYLGNRKHPDRLYTLANVVQFYKGVRYPLDYAHLHLFKKFVASP